ncbi:MAG: hypothetical protein ACREJG_02580 [Candidatus Rokuibacteriota bacterium]
MDRSNHKKVVIDWRQPVRGATEAADAHDPGGAPTPPVSRPARRSSWLLLRWFLLVFGLIFLRLGCEAGSYEGGVRAEGVVVVVIRRRDRARGAPP